MSEPDFVSKTDEPMTPDERMAWLRKRVDEANANGAVFHRASVHPDMSNLTLHEAWKVRPDDQGEPRWGLVADVGGESGQTQRSGS